MEREKSHRTIGAFSSRSFLSRRHTKNHASGNVAADTKGDVGLTTLHDPRDTSVADLVFVHGLGGGSRSTWIKSDNPSLYWIQEWLPNDPGFQDVRIHSFGYNSNWGKESVLNLHDFAKSLLGSIQDSPSIPRTSNVCGRVSFSAAPLSRFHKCLASQRHVTDRDNRHPWSSLAIVWGAW